MIKKLPKRKAISKTNEVVRDIEKSYLKKELFSGKYTIAEINLLTRKISSEPIIHSKILKAIEEKRFNLDKLIESIKKENSFKKNLRTQSEKKTLSEKEQKTYIRYLEKTGDKKFAKQIVESLKEYDKKDIRIILTKIVSIKKKLSYYERINFLKKVIMGIKRDKENISTVLIRLDSIKERKRINELATSLLPNLDKK